MLGHTLMIIKRPRFKVPVHSFGLHQTLPNTKKATTKSSNRFSLGAEEGAQTLDPQLGRLTLYQLSYFRNMLSK